MPSFSVYVGGIEALKTFEKLSDDMSLNIVKALNKVADQTRTQAASAIGQQINFPQSYLAPSQGRLEVSQRSTRSRLSVTITARDRPTSLARFVVGSKTVNKPDVTISVRPGLATRLKRAFLVKLRNGNLALAIRLPKGQAPSRAYRPVEIGTGKGLWLLYGPSVDQAFKSLISGEGRPNINDDAAEAFVAEFSRLQELS